MRPLPRVQQFPPRKTSPPSNHEMKTCSSGVGMPNGSPYISESMYEKACLGQRMTTRHWFDAGYAKYPVSQRSDRHRVENPATALAAAAQARAPAHRPTVGAQRDSLCAAFGLRVADVAAPLWPLEHDL